MSIEVDVDDFIRGFLDKTKDDGSEITALAKASIAQFIVNYNCAFYEKVKAHGNKFTQDKATNIMVDSLLLCCDALKLTLSDTTTH